MNATRKKLGRKLLGFLLALAMVIGMLPGMISTAYADYAAIWTEDQTIIWDKTIDGGVAVSTDAGIKLTIAEGKTLTVNGGITAGTRTLTIDGKGTLVVNGADQNTVGTTGDKGSDGRDGTYAQNCGGAGQNGGNGAGGGVGIEANLVVNGATVIVTGGTGGKGGKGGDGGNGYGGGPGEERRPGGSGGTGGTGGAGGVGIKGSVTVNSGSITVTGGAGGVGGDGGAAGQYGQGSFLPENRPTAGAKGQDGSSGQAVSGTITENEDAQESDDGSTWTAISGTTSTKRYVKVAHLHSFTYSASGDTITATCGKTGCDLTDNKATLTIAAPTLTTYGQTGEGISAEATITDENNIKGEAVVVYKNGDETLSSAPTNAGTYTASITLGTATAQVEYTIAKADPTTPTGLTATYGQTLADVTLPDGWTWADSTQSVGNVVSPAATFKANFAENDNYNAASNVDVAVTVGKAANPAAVTSTATVTKGGNTVDLASNIALNGATGEVTYAINGEANGCTLSGSVLTSGTNSGYVTVNVSIAADANYEALAATPITVTITDKDTQTITASDVTATYGDTNKSISATTDGNGAISYAVKDGSGDYIDVDASTGALTIIKVPVDGKAYVIVTAAGTDAYEQATKEVTLTINKAAPTVTAPTAKTLAYSGRAQKLVTAGSATGGTMWYAATTTNAAPTDENLYDTSIPTATAPGTYHVWYKVAGDENHTDATAQSVTSTIAGKSYPAPTVSDSRGGAIAPQSAEVTYTVSQRVPAWASSVRTWVDLESVLRYTTDASGVTVTCDRADVEGAVVTIDGQRLAVEVADATSLRGKTFQIAYKAKLRAGADLTPYLNGAKTTASVPYQAHTVFDGDEANAVSSASGSVRFQVGSSSGKTKATAASASKASTLARTGDATSLAGIAATALAGAGAVLVGWRRRR